MKRSAFWFVGIAALVPGTVSAHFKFLEPPSSLVTEIGGKGVLPWGEGIASGVVTKGQGGHPFTIRAQEFIPQPGHYRVALSVNSRFGAGAFNRNPSYVFAPDGQKFLAVLAPVENLSAAMIVVLNWQSELKK